jgi:hypothetical protein
MIGASAGKPKSTFLDLQNAGEIERLLRKANEAAVSGRRDVVPQRASQLLPRSGHALRIVRSAVLPRCSPGETANRQKRKQRPKALCF